MRKDLCIHTASLSRPDSHLSGCEADRAIPLDTARSRPPLSRTWAQRASLYRTRTSTLPDALVRAFGLTCSAWGGPPSLHEDLSSVDKRQ